MRLLLCILPGGVYRPDSLGALLSMPQRSGVAVGFFIHMGSGNTEPLCAFSALDLNPSRSGSWQRQPLNVNAVRCATRLVVHKAACSALESVSAP